MALRGETLFFTAALSGLVGSVPKDSKVDIATVAQNVPYVWAIAVDEDGIFFASRQEPSTLLRCPLEGCSGAPESLVTDQRITAIAVSGDYVYWTANQGQAVRRVAKTPPYHPEDLYTGSYDPYALVLDDQYAFFTEDWSGAVMRVPQWPAGDAGHQFAPDNTGATSIAQTSDRLFWTVWGQTGSVQWISKDLDPPPAVQTLASHRCISMTSVEHMQQGDFVEAEGLAVDDAFAYWAECSPTGNTASVVACALQGCQGNPQVLLADLPFVSGVLAAGESVYVAVRGAGEAAEGGGVVKIARPVAP